MTPILFFAAGKGTRMRHLTADRPKPLVRVAGKPLLDHAMALAKIDGIGQRVVNLHHKGAMIRDYLAGTNVAFSHEDVLLETGGGLRHAIPLLVTSPVITLNTDAVWRGPNPIQHLMSAWDDTMEALLLLIPKPQVIGHKGPGDFEMMDDGRLQRGPGAVYSGLQMIRTDTLSAVPEAAFSMNVVWDQMITRGGLFGLVYDGQWCDVGQPESIALAEEMLNV